MVDVLVSVITRSKSFSKLYIYFSISNIFDLCIAWIDFSLYPKNTNLKLNNYIL